MKRIIYLLALLLFGINFLQSQSPIIFRPGPGANDSTDQGGLTGGKDVWAYQFNTTNYGDFPYMITYPISNCNSTNCQSFIQFDLSTLPESVDSVFVVFNHTAHTTYCYSNCNADFYFARVTQPWYEMNVSYSNKPPHDTTFYGPINISFPNDFKERKYDITSTFRLWKEGTVPNYGMAIYSTTVGCNNACVAFSVSSSDDTVVSKRPYLLVYPHSTIGINKSGISESSCNIFPNPTGNMLNIGVSPLLLGSAYSISDNFGKTVLSGMLTAEDFTIDIKDLPGGVYQFNINGEIVKTVKVIKN